MNYSIGEFSKRTGLGIHTLRFYEHENLLMPIRNASNRRRYSDNDIAWVDFIKRLKETGMPIKQILAICHAAGLWRCYPVRAYGTVNPAPRGFASKNCIATETFGKIG